MTGHWSSAVGRGLRRVLLPGAPPSLKSATSEAIQAPQCGVLHRARSFIPKTGKTPYKRWATLEKGRKRGVPGGVCVNCSPPPPRRLVPALKPPAAEGSFRPVRPPFFRRLSPYRVATDLSIGATRPRRPLPTVSTTGSPPQCLAATFERLFPRSCTSPSARRSFPNRSRMLVSNACSATSGSEVRRDEHDPGGGAEDNVAREDGSVPNSHRDVDPGESDIGNGSRVRTAKVEVDVLELD